MLYSTDPNTFKFNKPPDWNSLPLYKKIAYYKTILNENYAPYVDKLVAKKIVKDLCGDKIKVANVIRVLNGPNDLKHSDLNSNYIIKSSHGSGWNINITESTNLTNSIRLLHSWNKSYSLIHNEAQYKYIKPRFFIEEKVNDKSLGKNGVADVYTFRCIQGNPISINIKHLGLFNKYDIEFNDIDKPQFYIEKPVELDRMIELSKILSKPFEFVRVDFYLDKNSDIYFSEFTFTPNAGYPFYSMEVEERLSSLWI
jgi:hypothetical protein